MEKRLTPCLFTRKLDLIPNQAEAVKGVSPVKPASGGAEPFTLFGGNQHRHLADMPLPSNVKLNLLTSDMLLRMGCVPAAALAVLLFWREIRYGKFSRLRILAYVRCPIAAGDGSRKRIIPSSECIAFRVNGAPMSGYKDLIAKKPGKRPSAATWWRAVKCR